MAERVGVQKGPKQLAFRFADKGQEAGGPLGKVLGEGVDVLHESVCAVHDAVREEGAGISRLMTSFTGEMAGLARNLGEAKSALDALKTEVSGGNTELGERLSGLATRVSEVQAALEKAVVGALESVRSSTLEAVETSKAAVTGAVTDSREAIVGVVAESEDRLAGKVGAAQTAVVDAVERKADETNLGVAHVFVAVQAVQVDVKAVLGEFTDAENGRVNLLIGALVGTSDKVDAGLERLNGINSALEAQRATLAVHTEALERIEHAVGSVETVAGRVLQESAAVKYEVAALARKVEVSVTQGGENADAVKAHVDARVAGLKEHVDGAVILMIGELGKLRAALGEGLSGVIAAVHASRLKPTVAAAAEDESGLPAGDEPLVVILPTRDAGKGEPVLVSAEERGPAPGAVVEAHTAAAPRSVEEIYRSEGQEALVNLGFDFSTSKERRQEILDFAVSQNMRELLRIFLHGGEHLIVPQAREALEELDRKTIESAKSNGNVAALSEYASMRFYLQSEDSAKLAIAALERLKAASDLEGVAEAHESLNNKELAAFAREAIGRLALEAAPQARNKEVKDITRAEDRRNLAKLQSYATMRIDGQTREAAKLAIEALERLKAADVLYSVRQRCGDEELAQLAGAAFAKVASLKERLTLDGDEALISMFLQPETAPERKGEILNLFLEEGLRNPILQIYASVEGDDKQSVRAALDKFDRDAIAEAKQKVVSGDLSGSEILSNYASMFVDAQSEESAKLAIAALEELKDVEALRTVQLNLSGYFDLGVLTTQAIERLTPTEEVTVVTTAAHAAQAARTEAVAPVYDVDALLERLRDKKDPSELQRAIDVAGEQLAVEAIPDLLGWVEYAAVYKPTDPNGLRLQGNEAMISSKAISALERIGLAKNENAEQICRLIVSKLKSTHVAGFLDMNAFQLINAKPLVRLTMKFGTILSTDLRAQVREELEFLREQLRQEDAAGGQTRVIFRDAVNVFGDIEEALAAFPKNGGK